MCVLVFQVTNQFLKQLGIHPSWQFVDVYGMDQELLSMVPRPVCAILLLFPVTEKYETFRTEEENKIKAQGQEVKPSVYFMKQTISNACGTIGLIHAIANNRDKINFEADSSLKKFLDDSVPMSPEERAKYLETYEAIRVTHESSAHEGQTESSSSLLPSPSSSQSQFSHCKMKASPLRRSASLTLIRCDHVASAKATSPVKATSPPVCLQRWRPTIPLSSIGLHCVVSVVGLPSLLYGKPFASTFQLELILLSEFLSGLSGVVSIYPLCFPI
ncbi:ubiquitin carboxyl-terminal hydrolase isozyme L3 isoform X1 [Sceloporus undulatus]|uniref:ubiquitin carboxyl-terminal hydrolase isozyme L3 isoform X1 n=1 Tax=Sceloporus undulatus TaxID=8520 RepID=UPI001C4AF131|nr:ubiquitin carboxyl-terminal hydrolase isozyme L3 isoform X1 [Sceloporus undulatus]